MKISILALIMIFICHNLLAQPQGINYQGVARDSVGHPILNQNISLRLSILEGSATGQTVYSETKNVLTSSSGLFNINIGMGNVVSGVFANIPWGTGDKWLKVEMDLLGGSNYQHIGTTQFLSVPYSNYSKTSGNGLPVGVNGGDLLYWNGTSWVLLSVGQPGQYLQLSVSGLPSWSGPSFATLSTNPVIGITGTTATCGGNITNDGGAFITARGVCWSINSNPTVDLTTKTSDGTGTGVFTSNLSNLSANTTYYVRAYATHSGGTSYGNQQVFTTTPIAIGQFYGGGIIFYVDGSAVHGLISAATDQGIANWGCSGIFISGASGTGIGIGQSNTTAIVSQCSTNGIAAQVCDNLILNGYSDWYLPSKLELELLYSQKDEVGAFANGSNAYYWTSTQVSAFDVWVVSFVSGYSGSPQGSKVGNYFVRAIRVF